MKSSRRAPVTCVTYDPLTRCQVWSSENNRGEYVVLLVLLFVKLTDRTISSSVWPTFHPHSRRLRSGTTPSVVSTRAPLEPGPPSVCSAAAILWPPTDTSSCSFPSLMSLTSVRWRSTFAVSYLKTQLTSYKLLLSFQWQRLHFSHAVSTTTETFSKEIGYKNAHKNQQRNGTNNKNQRPAPIDLLGCVTEVSVLT